MQYRPLKRTVIALLAGASFITAGTSLAGQDHVKTESTGHEAAESMAKSADTVGSLVVEDQKVSDNTVKIKDLTLPQDGYLVIHAAKANGKIKAPESIGHKMLKKGEHKNVSVKLDKSVKSGDKLFAMLHKDTGHHGEFEFAKSGGKTDGAVKTDDKPVIKPFMVK